MQTYTVDWFSSLDGFASAVNWPGYWGKEGPELVEQRQRLFDAEQLLVLGATTYRVLSGIASTAEDPTFDRVNAMPKVVLSKTMDSPPTWSNTTLIADDALDAIPRLKSESSVPLRSHGSLSVNRALLAAGLVDRLVVTVFPVITGVSGREPLFAGLPDLDLELVDSSLFDGRVQQLTYIPTLH